MPVTEKNKTIVQRLYTEALNKRDTQLLTQLISSGFTGINGAKGPGAFISPIMPLINAFPDIQWHISDILAEGDKVAIHWQWSGTFSHAYATYAANGKTIVNDGMAVFTCKDGQIAAAQALTDRAGFLQQAGILPQDLSALPAIAKTKEHVYFIDKFVIPAAAVKEFYERMHVNRAFIRKQPGFITDEVYAYTDENGNIHCITVACWTNTAALARAKEAVQAWYKAEGLDMPAMLKRLNITVDRGIYTAGTNE